MLLAARETFNKGMNREALARPLSYNSFQMNKQTIINAAAFPKLGGASEMLRHSHRIEMNANRP
jgi:hypothetical protein